MRDHEILNEYDRSKTAAAFGAKMLQKLIYDTSIINFPNLLNATRIINVARSADKNPNQPGTFSVGMFGDRVEVTAANSQQVLQHLTPQILDDILANIEQGDPTTNKQYGQWLAKMYANTNIKLEDIISTTRQYLTKFEILKRKKLIKSPANDINRYPSIQNFMDVLDTYDLPEEDIPIDKGESTEVYKDADVRIIVPENESAACYYGRGTRWCTAATQGHNYFDNYHRDGPLYILLPTKPVHDGEKYQLHFPSNQFMDEHDDGVDLVNLLKNRFPNLESFFLQVEPDIKDLLPFTPDEVLKPILEKIKEYGQEMLWETLSDWEIQDDYYRDWQKEQARENGYLLKDDGTEYNSLTDFEDLPGEDDDEKEESLKELEIDWERVHNDGKMNNYYEYNQEAYYYDKSVMNALNSSPEEIREYAQELMSEGDIDELNVGNLDNIMYFMINNELGYYRSGRNRESSPVADFIKEKVSIRWGVSKGEAGGKKGWQVEVHR